MIIDEYDSKVSLQLIARSELEQLAIKSKQTVTLSTLVGYEVQSIDKFDSNASVHVTHLVGRFSPLYAAASGKAILAFLSKNKFNDFTENVTFKKITEETVTNIEELNHDLEIIRKQGYAISHGELDLGVSAVAAPIFNHKNEALGSVTILGLSQSFFQNNIDKYSQLVLESCNEISKRLGY